MHYYDYHPLVYLEQPLCLVGFMGSGVELLGSCLASRTGLPLTELSRLLEHDVGMTRAQFHYERGAKALREAEARQLGKALSRQPAGIVVLSDGTLQTDANLLRVRRHSRLVYVQRPLEELWQRMQERWDRDRSSFPEFVSGVPKNPELLRQTFEARESGYRVAHLTLNAGNRSPQALADDLLSEFSSLH